jgi:rRNA maturation RNase YbeY
MPSADQKIHFHYLVPPFHFPDRTKLKAFLLRLCKKEGAAVRQVNYIFCSDAYLLDINVRYLKHDTLTDIITFQLSEKDEALVSDIYISINRVRENARQFTTTFQKELHRVIFHGALHLCGYKDKTQEQSRLMRKKESFYLNAWFRST